MGVCGGVVLCGWGVDLEAVCEVGLYALQLRSFLVHTAALYNILTCS